MADEDTERRGTLILRKIVRQCNEKEKADNTAVSLYVLQYIQVVLGREQPSFCFFFRGTIFTHAQYINIMYELDSTRQKFDV